MGERANADKCDALSGGNEEVEEAYKSEIGWMSSWGFVQSLRNLGATSRICSN